MSKGCQAHLPTYKTGCRRPVEVQLDIRMGETLLTAHFCCLRHAAVWLKAEAVKREDKKLATAELHRPTAGKRYEQILKDIRRRERLLRKCHGHQHNAQ